MNATVRHGCFAAAAIASSVLLAGPVSSQTLALSYGLDVNSGGVAHFETPVDRCSGVGPSLETAACSRPGLTSATNAVAELRTVRTSLPAAPSSVKDTASSDGDAPDSE